MITPSQQKWLDHLKDNEPVVIAPFDPTSEEKFLRVKKQVQNLLGAEQDVLHRGA